MFAALILIGFAFYVSKGGQPIVTAGIYAAVVGLFAMAGGIGAAFVSAIFAFGYSFIYFWLINRMADNFMLQLLIMFVGAALWAFLPFLFISSSETVA